jgi:hypothetical protein
MDAAYLDAVAKAQKHEGGGDGTKPQMTTATFDAMFA